MKISVACGYDSRVLLIKVEGCADVANTIRKTMIKKRL
jgi:hypothetical protein